MPKPSFRWFAWWYSAIAVGFAFLTIVHILMKDRLLMIGVRATIAAGFGLLAYMEFRSKGKR